MRTGSLQMTPVFRTLACFYVRTSTPDQQQKRNTRPYYSRYLGRGRIICSRLTIVYGSHATLDRAYSVSFLTPGTTNYVVRLYFLRMGNTPLSRAVKLTISIRLHSVSFCRTVLCPSHESFPFDAFIDYISEFHIASVTYSESFCLVAFSSVDD
jgi:hypothetical protein